MLSLSFLAAGAEPLLLAIGFAGQALFTLRILVQWFASERAGKSVVPRSYWWLSVVATVLLFVYALSTKDPVFLLGPLVNLFLYARNIFMMRRNRKLKPKPLAVIAPLGLAFAILGALTLYSVAREKHLLELTANPLWMAIGLTGMTLWASRYLVQWWISERVGKSVLPESFWWISTVGAMLLFAYAIFKVDWVFIVAYALNPIPYVRNIMLIRKRKPETEEE